MPKGTWGVRVTVPGKMGPGRVYCAGCFAEVLDQTQIKLNALREKLSLHQPGSRGNAADGQ